MPNYMQIYGILKAIKAKVKEWWLLPGENFKPNIEYLEKLVTKKY